MKAGDRVKIIGHSHPWKGYAGIIIGPPQPPIRGLDWLVAIDGTAQHSAASERDLRPASSHPGSDVKAVERDEMACDRCGRHHGVVWFAPSDIWNAVMREGDRGNPDEFSFCCPLCFIQLAGERGVVTTGWLVTPFTDGPVPYASQIVLRAANSQEGTKA